MFLQKIRDMCILILFICLTIELKAASPSPTWTQLSPSTSPTPRNNASMAFDPATGQLILFGGNSNGVRLNDTWNWNDTIGSFLKRWQIEVTFEEARRHLGIGNTKTMVRQGN